MGNKTSGKEAFAEEKANYNQQLTLQFIVIILPGELRVLGETENS